MRSTIILFPGTNRERDMALALERVSGKAPTLTWHKDTELPATDLVVVPGGFAHGDYLRAGAMAARSPIMDAVVRAAGRGVPVLGVCNGFQVLTEAGLLPGVLMRNAGLKFICRDVTLRVETTDSLFTGGYAKGQEIRVPVANNDGNYHADDATLDRLEGEGRVAFRYAEEVNGSARRIAGILNETKTVLGFMPHPEDAIDPALGGTDGLALFENLARTIA
jgi:phosphoribosylformylglycinamidine synthase I